MNARNEGGCAVRPAPGALLGAVLREIAQMLHALADDPAGEAAIDLRGPLLDGGDRAALRSFLGSGEVEARCDVAGIWNVAETAFAGVWWVRHAAADGSTLVEQIVVARAPAILLAHPADIEAAHRDLARRLDEVDPAAPGGRPA